MQTLTQGRGPRLKQLCGLQPTSPAAPRAPPPHPSWGRTPGCKSGISPSRPHSTCRRRQGWGCCTASGPAARPLHRCASRGRRAPTWPRSRPPARKALLHSCGVQAPHAHRDPPGELPGGSLHHPTPPGQNPFCFRTRDAHHTVAWR